MCLSVNAQTTEEAMEEKKSKLTGENFASKYYEKNCKLIEDFFVIGIDQDDIKQIEKSLS